MKLSAITVWQAVKNLRGTPPDIQRARVAAVLLLNSPILWNIDKMAQKILSLAQNNKGIVEISLIGDRSVREALSLQGVKRIKLENYFMLNKGALMIALKRIAAGMADKENYTYRQKFADFGLPMSIKVMREGAEVTASFHY